MGFVTVFIRFKRFYLLFFIGDVEGFFEYICWLILARPWATELQLLVIKSLLNLFVFHKLDRHVELSNNSINFFSLIELLHHDSQWREATGYYGLLLFFLCWSARRIHHCFIGRRLDIAFFKIPDWVISQRFRSWSVSILVKEIRKYGFIKNQRDLHRPIIH